MKLPNVTKHVAAAVRTIMVLTLLLIALVILQVFIEQIMIRYNEASRNGVIIDRPRLAEAQQKRQVLSRSHKRFMPDGTIHLVHTSRSPATPHVAAKRTLDIYDNHGKLLWSGPQKDQPYTYIPWADRGTMPIADRMSEMLRITGELSRSLIVPVVDNRSIIVERWRHDPVHGWFVGYNLGGRAIGYFGTEGVAASRSDVKPFDALTGMAAWSQADSFNAVLLLQTKSRVYQVDFASRSVELLIDMPGRNISLVRTTAAWRNSKGAKDRPAVFAWADNGESSILLAEPTERLTVSMPMPYPGFAATKDGLFLKSTEREWPVAVADFRQALEQQRQREARSSKRAVELKRIDEHGQPRTVNRYEWTVPPRTDSYMYRSRRVTESFLTRQARLSLASPLASELVWRWFIRDRFARPTYRSQFTQQNKGAWRAVRQLFLLHRPFHLAWVSLLAGVMVALALWHGVARRVSWIGLGGWLVVVGLFGVVGLLTYLAINHRPVIRCHACGRRRGLRTANCPACGAELETPARRQTDLILPEA